MSEGETMAVMSHRVGQAFEVCGFHFCWTGHKVDTNEVLPVRKVPRNTLYSLRQFLGMKNYRCPAAQ